MEMWAGAPTYLRKKMQSVQLSAARAAIGYKAYYWSTEKLLKHMGWLPIEKLLTLYTVKLAHQILQVSIPEVISYKIKNQIIPNPVLTRLSGPNKFGPRQNISSKPICSANIQKYMTKFWKSRARNVSVTGQTNTCLTQKKYRP